MKLFHLRRRRLARWVAAPLALAASALALPAAGQAMVVRDEGPLAATPVGHPDEATRHVPVAATPRTIVVRPSSSQGIDWGDAGAGAGAGLALGLVLVGGGALLARRRRPAVHPL